jgi:acyl-CoA thioester hydrolase
MTDPVNSHVDVTVRYFETDQMGVVHHVNYLVWFELGRTDLCERSGYPYADIERRGYRLMNSALHARYRRPARYGDTVRVTCWIEHIASRAIHFAYEVHRGNELLVTGRTEHVWVEIATDRPCRAPDELREAFEKLAGLSAANGKKSTPALAPKRKSRTMDGH